MTDALIPLLYSVKLLVHLATAKAPDTIPLLKISNRFTLISSIYRSLNMLDEAIVATIVALLFDAVEVASSVTACSNSPVSLFSWLASMTENIVDTGTLTDVSRSEQRIGLQSACINLFLKRKNVSCQIDVEPDGNSSVLTPTKAIDRLLASFHDSNSCDIFEQNCYLPINLGSLMRSVFSFRTVSSFPKDRQYLVQMELLKISVDMMFRVGSVLQGKWNVETSVTPSDHADLCLLAESLLKTTGAEAAINTDMLGAMINIVASVSMVSSHSYISLESLLLSQAQGIRRKKAPFVNHAEDYATKAKTMSARALEKYTDLDPIAFSVDLALDLYRYQLSRMCLDQSVPFQLEFKRLLSFLDNIQGRATMETSFALAWKHCLRSTLSKLCGMFSLEGEGFLSLQFAKWNLDVCRTSDCDFDGQIWSESVLLSLLSTNSVVARSDFEKVNGSIPLEALIQSCRLRLFLRGQTDKASLLDSQNRFFAILDDLKEYEVAPDNVLQDIVLWTRSTIFLGLAECSERQGHFQMSQNHVRRCFETCKDLCATVKRNKVSLSSGASSHPFWMRASVSIILLHCSQRQTECLLRIAYIQSRLGDYRQSVEYSFSALMTPALEAAGLDLKRTFAESVTLTRTFPALSSQEALCRRVFLRYKSKASPQDLVSEVFRTHEDALFLSIFDRSLEHGDVFVNHVLEQILDSYEIVEMKNGYQAFTAPMDSMTLHKSATKDFIRHRLTPQVSKIYDTVTLVAGCGEQPYLQLQYDAKLRDASIVLSCESSDLREASAAARGWLHDVVSAPNCDSLCRSWSYYLLGSLSLKSARRNGDLSKKWNDLEPFTNSSQFLSEAKMYFENSLLLLGSSCDILKRNALRSRALVNGPGSNKYEAMEFFRLISSSVGCSIKTRMLDSMSGSEECDDVITNIFESLENNASATDDSKSAAWFFHELGHVVPKEWRFVTAALCPSGELLLSSLDFSEVGDPIYSNACVDGNFFQETENPSNDDMYDFIVKPLKEIIHRSQAQLSDDRISLDQDENTRQDHTRKWWNTRKDLDSDLQEHIENVERVLLSSDDVRRVLCGLSFDRESYDFADEGLHSTRGNLTSRFDAVSLSDDINKSKSYSRSHQSASRMAETVPHRKAKSMRFDTKNSGEGDSPDAIAGPNYECTFLILDEHLSLFPFEGLQCFERKALCRMPSLPFLLAKLTKDGVERYPQGSIHPEKTSYILDPESNLASTKDRMAPFISSLQEKYDYSWRGVAGDPPTFEFMEEGLSQRDGLLLYFGHGGGQQFFSRAKIESLGQRSDRSLASLVLMGCGSGRLESVNTKKSKSNSKLPIHYEPEGIALSYLLAGSPCVVGNLWDVTDRDIDRYSMALVESIFEAPGEKSVAKCVAESRAACKMRYIVGCAPVCYGVPVFTRKQKSR
jgi:Peptidase family C50